ncbi:MAG: acetolactate synthase large subunit [Mycobacterium sp.]|nr:acetolactate synthase large subunit [Mycobacterium sp.]
MVWRDSPPNFALASAYSVLLVVLTSIGIFLYARVLRRNGQYATITGKEAATTRLDLGVWRWAVTAGVLVYALIVVVVSILTVMVNNRAYNNDWNHQLAMADRGSTPRADAEIRTTIDDPAVGFAALARSFGWHAEGPVTDLDELPAALKRAAAVVQTGKPALVDVVCWPEPPR